MKRKDANEIAFETLQKVIGAIPNDNGERQTEAANLGRNGGVKGGKARADSLSPTERAEIARKAATARWKAKAGQP